MKNKFLPKFLVCLLVLVGSVALSACGKTNDPSNPDPSDPTTYTLTLSADGNGEVYGSGSYKAGEDVSIYAVPSANSFFAYWDDGVVEPTRTVKLSNNLNLTAHFIWGVGESKIINGHRVTVENGVFANESDDNYFKLTTVEPIFDDDFGYWEYSYGDPISTEHSLRISKNTISEDCIYSFQKWGIKGYIFGVSESSNMLPSHLDKMQKVLTMDTNSLSDVHSLYNGNGKNDFTEYSTISGDKVYEITLENLSRHDYLILFPIFDVSSTYWCTAPKKISLINKPTYYSVSFVDGGNTSQIIFNLTYEN